MENVVPNADLIVGAGNMVHWTQARQRRHGFHNLHHVARYCSGFRAARVLKLSRRFDARIARMPEVQHFTSLPMFSAMAVLQEDRILFERYAADFGRDKPHSIQSISKTMVNLLAGRLVEEGSLDRSRTIGSYLPEIGSAYAGATVQQTLNMDVVNDYSEDFTNPEATYFAHEEAMGWRLPRDANQESTERAFLKELSSQDVANPSRQVQYKDANTAVMGWVISQTSGRPLLSLVADIADAAGVEGSLWITTDREGFPTFEGGACLTALDLARYFLVFVRWGQGANGKWVGSRSFIEETLGSGVKYPPPYERFRYSNHTRVVGRSLGHTGWGGQCALANLDSGIVAVFFSVLENLHGVDRDYQAGIFAMLEAIVNPSA